MLKRLSGEDGARLRLEAFAAQKIVAGDKALAAELAQRADLVEFKVGTAAIEQEQWDNDVYFLLAGFGFDRGQRSGSSAPRARGNLWRNGGH